MLLHQNKKDAFFHQARINMIKNQIMPHAINNHKLVKAMLHIPRETFITSKKWQDLAYIDDNILLEDDRALLKPDIIARMLDNATVQQDDKVLIIGDGSGYIASLVSLLAKETISIESISALSYEAHKNLLYLNIKNFLIVNQLEMELGYYERGPFDIIIIADYIYDTMPITLLDQLSQNGRALSIVKHNNIPKMLKYWKNNNHQIQREELFLASIEKRWSGAGCRI